MKSFAIRDRGHYLWRGRHRREKGWVTKFWVSKSLGKWKIKQHKAKGWVLKIYCHLQTWLTQILKTEKHSVNSHMSIYMQYVNQSESLSWSFSDLSAWNWNWQHWNWKQHETLKCRKLHKQLSNSCYRSGKGHMCDSCVYQEILFGATPPRK
jgi:hypothetical protein